MTPGVASRATQTRGQLQHRRGRKGTTVHVPKYQPKTEDPERDEVEKTPPTSQDEDTISRGRPVIR